MNETTNQNTQKSNYTLSQYERAMSSEMIALFTQTFSDSEGEAEGKTIGLLVGDLLTTTSEPELKGFVAKQGERLIAGVLFTPLRFENGEVGYLLSPMATWFPTGDGSAVQSASYFKLSTWLVGTITCR
ncbi:hypothetical protein ACOMICROBIO_NCLOACGD_04244 [Vibrio sp. B1ASS3]|nr:hypothetical protein ACOMICROBIO_NCLOACGD_04244 [Vibrio sp. B1ASS3]CAE6949228.1 hypothetical protein ACOMICROBIO_NCLOACGD_04244 [Vibrio sp. B1ASS3]